MSFRPRWISLLNRSLFGRLLAGYVALVVAGLLIVGLSLSYLAGNYIRDQVETELRHKAQQVGLAVQELWPLSPWETPSDELLVLLRFLEMLLNSQIYLFNQDGKVVAYSSSDEEVPMTELPQVLLERFQEGVVHSGVYRLREDGPRYIIAIVPIRGETHQGGVLAAASLDQVHAPIGQFREVILWASLVLFVMSLFIGSYHSWQITRRLKGLQQSIMEIRHGRYPAEDSQPLLETSGDEIDELAREIAATGQDLARMERSRKQSEESRRQLFADVSHELRTPLTAIHGFVEVLRDGMDEDPSERARYLELIHDQTEHLGRLVDDLLALSRLDAGDVQLVVIRVPLDALTAGVVERYDSLAKRLGVQLTFHSDVRPGAEGDAWIMGDPDRLEQILANLLKNAIDVSADGTVDVHVGCEKDMVVLSVRDSGPGIPSEDIPRVWERFFKVDRSRKRGGTGLGLAIVRRLVELHKGEVEIESHPGSGSVFKVYFPRAQDDRA